MTQPIDSCRLYFALRDMAWCGTEPAADAAAAELNITGELGLSEGDARVALEDLLEADLVHRIASLEDLERDLDEMGPVGGRLIVEPMDDLTAATIIFGMG